MKEIRAKIIAEAVANAYGFMWPRQRSALTAAPCPECKGGYANLLVACKMCNGAGRIYHLHGTII